MTVRCKMVLSEIKKKSYGTTVFVFSTQYDSGIPEDQRFQKATPSGFMEIHVDNPAVLEEYKLGQAYYFDMTPAPATPAG